MSSLPTLVSNDKKELSDYRDWACQQVDVPAVEMQLVASEMQNACMYVPRDVPRLRFGMWRKLWNNTCSAVVGDISGVHAGLPYARRKRLKILASHELQRDALMAMGVPPDEIVLLATGRGDKVLCVERGQSIHTVETLAKGWDAYYHRMLSYRGGGADIAKRMQRAGGAQPSGTMAAPRPAVVFMRRCQSQSRTLVNEEDAFRKVNELMLQRNRSEELVPFCGDNMTFAKQAAVMSRATTVIGPHGGAMANLLYVRPSCETNVIEFVGNTENPGPGHEPYKSYYFHGMGSAFSYRLVLFDAAVVGAGARGGYRVRLDDLELALQEIWR